MHLFQFHKTRQLIHCDDRQAFYKSWYLIVSSLSLSFLILCKSGLLIEYAMFISSFVSIHYLEAGRMFQLSILKLSFSTFAFFVLYIIHLVSTIALLVLHITFVYNNYCPPYIYISLTKAFLFSEIYYLFIYLFFLLISDC